MKFNITGIILYTLLLAGLTGLSSCKDDDLILSSDAEDEQLFDDGPSISFSITLDDMGGVGASNGLMPSLGPKTVRYYENYIDPQNCRILFFDSNDKFIFESKSRYVKKRSSTSGEYSEWTVTVPFYDYGNDRDENWPWTQIKNKLLNEQFKIAILANHPEREYNMGIVGRGYNADGSTNSANYETDEVVPNTWFRNDGPNWDRTNSVCGGTNVKDVFDLHHCQTDMIYKGKNHDQYHPYNTYSETTVNGKKTGTATANHSHENIGFYDKICTYRTADETATGSDGNCQTGPSVSWVHFDNDDNSKDPKYDLRYSKMPSEQYPIPMYGIQRFQPIPADKWIDGSTYRLEGKAISLLRSCVKLELLIPVEFDVEQAALVYSNIYSRCEPLNVWDPTDEVWERNHADASKCEWKRVWDYGVMTENGSYGTDRYRSRDDYWKKIGWIYANWRKSSKGWHYGFGNTTQGYQKGKEWVEGLLSGKPEPPEIFNPCIQRNNFVMINLANSMFSDIDRYHHIIVYTGERSPNDPTNLANIGSTSAGDPTLFWWQIWVKKKGSSTGQLISLPVCDYDNCDGTKAFASENYTSLAAPSRTLGTNDGTAYMQRVQKKDAATPLPLPFLRNHVYRITLTGKTSSSYPDNWDRDRYPEPDEQTFTARFDHLYSRSIGIAPIGKNPALEMEVLQPKSFVIE